MIKIKNLSFSYSRNKKLIENLDLDLEAGGIYGLLGKNGIGKSTLLYLMSGMIFPDSGEITYCGKSVADRLPSVLTDTFIVPEEFSLPKVTLAEYCKYNAKLYPRFDQDALNRYLAIFELEDDLNLGALSMGQKKKAYMSFALACNTRLLLMDEPSNGLDIPGKAAFKMVMASARHDDRITVISTHQVRDLERLLDHIIMLDRSGVILNTSVENIENSLQFAYTNDPEEIRGALFSEPIPGTTAVITGNTTGLRSEMNLETLFSFALKDKDLLDQLLNRRENR